MAFPCEVLGGYVLLRVLDVVQPFWLLGIYESLSKLSLSEAAEVCNCDGVPYGKSEGEWNHEVFSKFDMAYVGGCLVDTWAETHD